MKRFTSREIFGAVILLLVGVTAFFSWSAFFDVTIQSHALNIFGVLLWFSALGSLLFLGAVIWNTQLLRGIGIILTLWPSALFVTTWYHIALVLVSMMIIFLSMNSMQAEIRDRVRFQFFRTARFGSFSIIFGLSLALSSAYFVSIKGGAWEDLVPRFYVGENVANVIVQTVTYLHPAWKSLNDEGTTVDAFLLSLPKEEGSLAASPVMLLAKDREVSPELAEALKQEAAREGVEADEAVSRDVMLRVGREQIASLVGRSVAGDEKIAEVLSLAMQNKVLAILNSRETARHTPFDIIPFVLAILFFLTLIPVGSVAAVFWIFVSSLLFRGALRLGWLRMERVAVEREVLLP